LEEQLLIKNSVLGNENSFAMLIKIYRKRLYSYFMKNCLNRSAADDLFQETIFKVWKNLDKYNEQNKFSGWLFSIAHNVLIDWFRKNKNNPVNNNLDEMMIDSNYNLIDSIETKELSEIINKKIDLLSTKQKRVFLLRQHSGMTFKEISELTGDSINTVLSHMNYAVKKIRSSLKEENAI
jgi:RNA polymerase sigma-70 factor (ECF subfamily)